VAQSLDLDWPKRNTNPGSIRAIWKHNQRGDKSPEEMSTLETPGLSKNEVVSDSMPNPVNWEDGILNLISPVSNEARIIVF
jgi:hypothetical protein